MRSPYVKVSLSSKSHAGIKLEQTDLNSYEYIKTVGSKCPQIWTRICAPNV